MLCGDKKEVEWHYSDLVIAPFVTSEQVEQLRSDHLLTRILAHAPLTSSQLRKLYRGRKSWETSARGLKAIGVRIIRADVADYCEGIYLRKLWLIFASFPAKGYNVTWTRPELIKALIRAT